MATHLVYSLVLVYVPMIIGFLFVFLACILYYWTPSLILVGLKFLYTGEYEIREHPKGPLPFCQFMRELWRNLFCCNYGHYPRINYLISVYGRRLTNRGVHISLWTALLLFISGFLIFSSEFVVESTVQCELGAGWDCFDLQQKPLENCEYANESIECFRWRSNFFGALGIAGGATILVKLIIVVNTYTWIAIISKESKCFRIVVMIVIYVVIIAVIVAFTISFSDELLNNTPKIIQFILYVAISVLTLAATISIAFFSEEEEQQLANAQQALQQLDAARHDAEQATQELVASQQHPTPQQLETAQQAAQQLIHARQTAKQLIPALEEEGEEVVDAHQAAQELQAAQEAAQQSAGDQPASPQTVQQATEQLVAALPAAQLATQQLQAAQQAAAARKAVELLTAAKLTIVPDQVPTPQQLKAIQTAEQLVAVQTATQKLQQLLAELPAGPQ